MPSPNLQAWMDQYAARFQSPMMNGGQPPAQNLAAGMPGAGQPAPAPAPPAPVAPAPTVAAPAAPQDPNSPAPAAGGDAQSFEQVFKSQPVHVQDKHVDDLEDRVGDINKAYDHLQQQLGQRPDPKLSRREKGMLIMEFGLQLMSQSSRGDSTLGAVGDAGSKALGSYANLSAQKKAEGRQWDQSNTNLALGRLKDTSAARKEVSTEARQATQDQLAQTRADEAARHNQAMEDSSNARITNLEDWRTSQRDNKAGPFRPPSAGRAGGSGAAGGGGNTTFAVKLREYESRYPLPKNPTEKQRQEHNSNALAFASGAKPADHSKMYLQARAAAQKELARPDQYMGDKPYGQVLDELTTKIYEGQTDRTPDPIITPKDRKVARTGKTKDGRKVVQYEDGSTEYAD